MDKCMATVAELWVLCDDTCTKWYTHHLLPLLEAPPPNCVKPPKRTIRQAACQLRSATLYFTGRKKKSRNKRTNKMQKQGPMIQWSCSLITADAPLQMRTLAQKASSGTHDSRIPWMHGTTYGWYMSDTRHHHGDTALKPFLCWGWQPALRSVPMTPMNVSRFSLLLLVTQIVRNVWSNPELVMFDSWTGSLLHEPTRTSTGSRIPYLRL